MLQPGESQTLVFSITATDLASFDPAKSSWIADAGTYTIKAGASSLQINQTANLQLPAEIVVKKVNRVLAPATAMIELSSIR